MTGTCCAPPAGGRQAGARAHTTLQKLGGHPASFHRTKIMHGYDELRSMVTGSLPCACHEELTAVRSLPLARWLRAAAACFIITLHMAGQFKWAALAVAGPGRLRYQKDDMVFSLAPAKRESAQRGYKSSARRLPITVLSQALRCDESPLVLSSQHTPSQHTPAALSSPLGLSSAATTSNSFNTHSTTPVPPGSSATAATQPPCASPLRCSCASAYWP